MAAKVLLLEIQPRNVTTGARETVRFAGGGADYPYRYNGVDWKAGLSIIPQIISQIDFDGQNLALGAIPQALTLEWNPSSDADVNAQAARHWKGAPFTLYLGDENAAGTLPAVLISGTCLSHKVTDSVLQLAMADPGASLKRPIITDTFAGTGGIEGPTEWKGRRKRRCWGYCYDVEGEPIDPPNNIYCFSDPSKSLYGFAQVRDKGVAFTTTTTVAWAGSIAATFAALQGTAVANGAVALCPSIGMVKTWTRPSLLCADIQGEIGPGYAELPAAICNRILLARSGPALDATSYANALSIRPDSCGYVADDLNTEISAALDWILGGVSLMWVLDAVAGTIRIEPWEFGTSVASFTSDHAVRVNTFPPLKSRRIGYRRNHRVHTQADIAAILTYGDGTPIDDYQSRIVTAIRADGSLQGELWGGADGISIVNVLNSGLVGKSLSLDADFTKGVIPSTYGIYNNAGGSKVTMALVADYGAPNGSGKVLRVSYDGTGTENSNPTPGFGGVVQGLQPSGYGISRPGYYAEGTTVLWAIRAKIPVGRSISVHTNSLGTGGTLAWLSAQAGTGAWETYLCMMTAGIGGSPANTGYLAVYGGANTAFSWDIASYDQREIGAQDLPQLNRLIDGAANIRTDAELVTNQGTANLINNQGPGATALANAVMNNLTSSTTSTIAKPDGGLFTYDNAITGVIKISLPQAYLGTMISFTVDVYDYQAGGMVTYRIGGYAYAATSSTNGYWIFPTATFIGPEGFARRVRFGYDGSKCCIWIGETGTVWQYPKIEITDVRVGYLNTALNQWATGWAIAINTTAPSNPGSYGVVEVTKPRAGDAVFGEGIKKVAGGATANLADFETILGTALLLYNSGTFAYKNNLDLSNSTDVIPKGSIPPMVPDGAISYTSTTASISFSWSAFTVYRPDGTTLSVASGSQSYSSLPSSFAFRFYPYVTEATGVVGWVSGGTNSYGSPAIGYTGGGHPSAASQMYLQGRVPLGPFTASTTSSGSGGGSGGGSNCIHEDVLLGNVRAGDVRPGDMVPTPDGLAEVLCITHYPVSRWIELRTEDLGIAKVTAGHLFYLAKDGRAIRADKVRLGDILMTHGDHVEITGLAMGEDTAMAVGILLEDPHLHFVGPRGLLCHNGNQKP